MRSDSIVLNDITCYVVSRELREYTTWDDYMDMCISVSVRIYAYLYTHVYITYHILQGVAACTQRKYICIYIRNCIHANTYTYIHTYMHV